MFFYALSERPMNGLLFTRVVNKHISYVL